MSKENIVVFDTETTSLNKPFCYNVAYNIVDPDTQNSLLQKEFVVEQVWHNKMCFASSYYAEKRPFYVKGMRSRKIKMDKFGRICQEMIRDFKAYNVTKAFAYNSSFDEKVFDFNCDWFKCNNPFDTIEIKDIRGFVHNFIIDDDYKKFCEENNRFTDSGNYSTTAETVMQYVSNNIDFIEDHTALSDSLIETEILFNAINKGADIDKTYPVQRSITRNKTIVLKVKKDGKIVFTTDCKNYRIFKTKNEIVVK